MILLDFVELYAIISKYTKEELTMKKVICKKEYDTETATLIQKHTYSYYGDPAGYEESLYQTPGGLYFLYVKGGEASPYPNEDILRLARTKVQQWLDTH